MGQQSISVLVLTFKASGAVPRRRAIGFNGARATVAGQKVMGVSPRDAGDGTYSDVTVIGTEVIETGGAFVAGDSLIVDAQGRAVIATDTAGEFVFADALDVSAGQGSFVEVLLRR